MLGPRALVIQKALRDFDSSLYLNQNYKGELQIMKKSNHYICSLTRDWTSRTEPVDWGVLPILEHMRAIDSQNKDSLVNQLEKMHLKDIESKKRDLANKTEAFCYDWHSQFKKGVSDINVSNLEKIDSRNKREK